MIRRKTSWLVIAIVFLGVTSVYGQKQSVKKAELIQQIKKNIQQLEFRSQQVKGQTQIELPNHFNKLYRNTSDLDKTLETNFEKSKSFERYSKRIQNEYLSPSLTRGKTAGNDTPTTQAVTANNQDSLALVALYNSTNGDNWDNNDGWLNDLVDTWHGITVNSEGRVTEIFLGENNLTGNIPEEIGDLTALEHIDILGNSVSGTIPPEFWQLTQLVTIQFCCGNDLEGQFPSNIGEFSNLITLDLGGNDKISGTVPNTIYNATTLQYITLWGGLGLSGEINSDFGNLVNLRAFNIEGSNFTGTVPASIQNLNSLEIFYTEGNSLSGQIPAEIGNLTILREFNVEENDMSGQIPPEIGQIDSLRRLELSANNSFTGQIPSELGNLSKLEGLDLDHNSLEGSIPTTLGQLDSLETLRLHNNQLTGEIPAELGNMESLKELSLMLNQLSGGIPAELGNLSNLDAMRLEGNSLTGNIPVELGNLTNLTRLNLNQNSLEGEIPSELGNLSELITLSLFDNSLTGNIPTELGNLSNLTDLELHLNSLSGNIPVQLSNLTELWRLNLSGNPLEGEIPSELGNLSNLEILALASDSLMGNIPQELGNLSKLRNLNLGNNSLEGEIPTELGGLSNLQELLLYNNSLTGSIPPEIGNLTNLWNLDIGGNPFTGTLPSELGDLENLVTMFIWGTEISGEIPPELGNLSNLVIMNLSTNKFTGNIPAELGNLSNLTFFGLYNNNWETYQGEISGEIPPELGNLTNLTVFGIYGQSLTGEIPPELGNLKNVTFFGLYQNQLSGSIPTEITDMESMTYMGLSNNQLTGSIPSSIDKLTSLDHVNLGDNQLTGQIPAEIGNITQITRLDLAGNDLTGTIPDNLGNLTNLNSVWLSNNSLEGAIPEAWTQFENLFDFNIRVNQFSSLPDFSGAPESFTDGLFLVDSLKLTFDDIIPNLNVPADSLEYAPQRPFGQPRTIRAATGSTVELTPGADHADNSYQWYKDDQPISGATSRVLTIKDVSESDYGTYHVEVTNSNVSDLTIQSEPFTLENYNRFFERSYTAGWNLVSLPFEVSDGAIDTHFPDANNDKAFGYSGSYDPVTTLETKQGYWLKFEGDGISDFEGEVSSEMQIELTEGWNLIGAPGESALYSDIDDPDGILMDNTLQGYNGAYQTTDELLPAKGYFVRASADGTVTLNIEDGVQGKDNTPKPSPVKQFDEIIVSNGTVQQSLYINGNLDRQWDRANFSVPPIPPDPLLDVRFSGDYRLSEADSVSFDIISKSYPVTLRLESENTTESYYISGVSDGKTGQYHELVPGQSVTLQRPYKKISVYTGKYMDENLPEDFALNPNYPNPFNPATTIQYQLPEQVKVSVQVYDLLGRRVATLINKEQKPGTHTVRFDASAMSSGMYFVRLQAGTFQQIQKITLIK